KQLHFDTRDTVGFDKTKVECFNCYKIGHFAKDCRAKWNQDSRRRDGGYNGNKARDNRRRRASQDDSKALVTIDGDAVDWSGHVEEDTQNFAMMAYSFSNSGSDNKVQSCSKTCAESYARLKKFYDEQRDKLGHFAKDCRAKWNQDSRRRDGGYNGNKAKDNRRRRASQDDSKALVTIDGEAVDWSGHVEEDTQNFAMMAYSFSNSGSDNKVQSCSKTCAESYARLKKFYDEQRDKLGDASVEITAYTLALKKVEA
nr:hypothetical protein [Tanacetum cinerariifolium]